MKLRDITLCASLDYPLHPQFNGEANCTTHHYLRHLGPVSNRRISKLIIEVGQPKTNIWQVDVDIYQVTLDYAPSTFLSLPSDLRKKEVTLTLLLEGTGIMCRHFGWPLGPYEQAAESVRADGYENVFTFEKPKWSPGRALRAEIVCEYSLKDISIGIAVFDRTNTLVLKREGMFKVQPHEIFLVSAVKGVHWLDARTVAIVSPTGGELTRISLRAS